ncbi:hypothetical protein EWH99_04900 [Sporolactobacillus sp. THM7-7]|nr:hypothetical protein EWH99_04900 [Sporolactobacillus sp. THM7-7]
MGSVSWTTWEETPYGLLPIPAALNATKGRACNCNGEPCDFHYVDANEQVEPADLLIFTVKYIGLKQAIEHARNQVGPRTILISFLNGIRSEQMIGEAFGFNRLLYCIVVGMDASKNSI